MEISSRLEIFTTATKFSSTLEKTTKLLDDLMCIWQQCLQTLKKTGDCCKYTTPGMGDYLFASPPTLISRFSDTSPKKKTQLIHLQVSGDTLKWHSSH